MTHKLYLQDCLLALKTMSDDSIDALVTDPPAGISFMGKAWDDDKGGRKQWVAWMTEIMAECLRVLKPGAHGFVWALPRTSHWTATALEDAGFEVRDVVTHLFGSGFPKSLDVSKAIDKATGAEREVVGHKGGRYSTPINDIRGGKLIDGTSGGIDAGSITAPATDAAKQWAGWGTALKPASEHWILIRKPCSEKTVAANVLKWGTGALNIDASRVEGLKPVMERTTTKVAATSMRGESTGARSTGGMTTEGRFPANLVLSHTLFCDNDSADGPEVWHCDASCAVRALDEQSGTLKSGMPGIRRKSHDTSSMSGRLGLTGDIEAGFGDTGGASRFFYCAKASKRDKGADNVHPTVKSTELMTYLIRMITPPGGTVLDPFMGSGSTGVAARELGFEFTGVEKDPEYFNIASKRVLR